MVTAMDSTAPNPETAKALMRAARIPDVMLSLYRAVHCSDHAQKGDIPWEEQGRYRQAAEMAVLMLAEPSLVDAADYFAAEQLHLERTPGQLFESVPAKRRYEHVLNMRLALRRWFMFLRGEWPQAVPVYERMAAADKATILASNRATAARALRVVRRGQ